MSTVKQANELYEEGLNAFRAGDNERCIALTTASLEIGRQLNDNDIVGQALMGLCRAALRNRDEDHLHCLSKELAELAEHTGDDWWCVVRAHMNAEMARMLGALERANELYDESMRLSEALGSENMMATECFNKSFVAVAQHNLEDARTLLQRHFTIRSKLDEGDLNPYGLIGVANLLVAEGKTEQAAEASFVCRRLLNELNVIPDPADEAPLKMVEEYFGNQLSRQVQSKLRSESDNMTCRQVVTKLIG